MSFSLILLGINFLNEVRFREWGIQYSNISSISRVVLIGAYGWSNNPPPLINFFIISDSESGASNIQTLVVPEEVWGFSIVMLIILSFSLCLF